MTSGAATAALRPGTNTISPAAPSDTSKSVATSGRKPTGRNSVVTIIAAPSASVDTPNQVRIDG
jgi:hypothetical protein